MLMFLFYQALNPVEFNLQVQIAFCLPHTYPQAASEQNCTCPSPSPNLSCRKGLGPLVYSIFKAFAVL